MERKPATYADLVALPDNVVGELIGGVLHASPRPAGAHAVAGSYLGGVLVAPFVAGQGGPGGWVILDEPELHLGEDVLVPDLAGWHRERLPNARDVVAFTVVPDWVCEVLSPSTKALDRQEKLPIYAREGVRHVWLMDPRARTLEVFRLEGAEYALLATYSGGGYVRVEPFESIELSLEFIWGG
ncbi:Uma2 family endonuclease [Pyxidicoccus fallax]|uniref:Uma2 family endonuclease n=1 Tax=Pyxidicoccus fallax TaxID=394095 RepID=A0A848LMA3_9BACT|nr:Uma2 family endonuclease [Pyxidicoccus fallax]NMO18967.1 Uma2 family endonuclease [Pyxidicoccus fallax]NPC79466.1 Uma2 family endonuclease [Pyxidicoccus fallax]